MKHAFKQFMRGILDYAGMFPPAGLDLETALETYEDHKGKEHGHMLGNFVISLSELHRLPRSIELPLSIVLASPLPEASARLLRPWAQFIRALEIRLPKDMSHPADLSFHVADIQQMIRHTGIEHPRVFLESGEPDQGGDLIKALGGIEARDRHGLGFKFRCGGVDNRSVPGPDTTASIIKACATHDVPLKFTAGLHHPFCRFSTEPETGQHGFVNIFSAALLAFDGKTDHGQLMACLTDETHDNFVFTGTGFSWRGLGISSHAIQGLRREKVMSFGSCSIEEPLADLRTLGHIVNFGE